MFAASGPEEMPQQIPCMRATLFRSGCIYSRGQNPRNRTLWTPGEPAMWLTAPGIRLSRP